VEGGRETNRDNSLMDRHEPKKKIPKGCWHSPYSYIVVCPKCQSAALELAEGPLDATMLYCKEHNTSSSHGCPYCDIESLSEENKQLKACVKSATKYLKTKNTKAGLAMVLREFARIEAR